MALSQLERCLKMANDLAKYKPERIREDFRKGMIRHMVMNSEKYYLTKEEVERLKQEL